jgi:hypothetical protein
MSDMLHNKERKSKGENRACFRYLHATNDASTRGVTGVISCSKNKAGLQNFHD